MRHPSKLRSVTQSVVSCRISSGSLHQSADAVTNRIIRQALFDHAVKRFRNFAIICRCRRNSCRNNNVGRSRNRIVHLTGNRSGTFAISCCYCVSVVNGGFSSVLRGHIMRVQICGKLLGGCFVDGRKHPDVLDPNAF